MKYLYVMDGGSSFKQTNDEPTQEELEAVYNGEIEVLQFDKDRGFCRAEVEQNENDEDEFKIEDWERIDVS